MKKVKVNPSGIFYVAIFFFPIAAMMSCTKCVECHYEKDGTDFELPGEFCDDEIETIEANGYTDTSGTYPVHCGEH